MKKKILIIVAIITVTIGLGIICILALKDSEPSYEDFTETIIHQDFTSTEIPDTSFFRKEFDLNPTGLISGTLIEEIDDSIDYPTWITDIEVLYPEDAINYKIMYKFIENNLEFFSLNITQDTSYFSYSDALVTVFDIDSVKYVVVMDYATGTINLYPLESESELH